MRDRAEFSLLKALREGKKEALAGAFNWYYKDLVLFAGNYIRNLPQCEDIVQNVFIRLWEERAGLHIESSLKSYLIRAVRNACLDHIRQLKLELKDFFYFLPFLASVRPDKSRGRVL